MSDAEFKIKITNDSGDFEKGLKDSEKSASKLGEVLDDIGGGGGNGPIQKIAKLISSDLVVGLGLAGTAALALKKSLDFTMDAERDQQIKKSFNDLAASFRLSGAELQNGLMASLKGLADDGDVLEAASRGLVALGANAKVLPEAMEMARKATALFGGDLVANFETFNNSLASGNVRALRQFGIIVDAKKAQEDYAKTAGFTASALSEAGQKQAIINAALDQARIKFANVDEDTLKATNAYKGLGASLKQLAGEFSNAFQASETWKTSLDGARGIIDTTALILNSKFGPANEQATSKVKLLENGLQKLKDRRDELEKGETMFFGLIDVPKRTGEIAQLNDYIAETRKRLSDLQAVSDQEAMRQSQRDAANGKGVDGSGSGASGKPKADDIDWKKVASQRAQAEQMVQGMRASLMEANSAYYSQNSDLVQRTIDLDLMASQRREMIANEYELKKRALVATNNQNELLTTQQMNESLALLEAEKQVRIATIQSDSQAQMIARSKQLGDALKSSLGSGAASAISNFSKALANGENAFEAFGRSLLDMLGDVALQVGAALFIGGLGLEAFQKGFPQGSIVYGAALLAIGGALKAFAGKTGGSAGGGGVASSTANAGGEVTSTPELQSTGATTQVALYVQGDVFDTRETGLRMAEILRDEFASRDVRIA